MKKLMKVGPNGVTCWPEGTDAFGPSFDKDAEVVVEWDQETVTHPLSGKVFYVVAFWDKGAMRRFEVNIEEVKLIDCKREPA